MLGLAVDRVRITALGVAVVKAHVSRFDPDPANAIMVARLDAIAAGRIAATGFDRNFYCHELREFVRYRRLGWKTGAPLDQDAAHELWNNAHTAALEEYGVAGPNTSLVLYHPEALV